MDSYDTNILHHLQADGRISWSQLAEQVNLSASACQRRVQALEERGVIEGFTLCLNEAALGHHVKAFIAVNIERQNLAQAEAFREQIRLQPYVQACHMLSGDIDFMLEVVAEDLEALGRFMEEQLLSMPAVKDASSSIVLKVVKPHRAMIA